MLYTYSENDVIENIYVVIASNRMILAHFKCNVSIE